MLTQVTAPFAVRTFVTLRPDAWSASAGRDRTATWTSPRCSPTPARTAASHWWVGRGGINPAGSSNLLRGDVLRVLGAIHAAVAAGIATFVRETPTRPPRPRSTTASPSPS